MRTVFQGGIRNRISVLTSIHSNYHHSQFPHTYGRVGNWGTFHGSCRLGLSLSRQHAGQIGVTAVSSVYSLLWTASVCAPKIHAEAEWSMHEHEGGALWKGICAPIKGPQRTLPSLPPCEDPVRSWSPMNMQAGPHQTQCACIVTSDSQPLEPWDISACCL